MVMQPPSGSGNTPPAAGALRRRSASDSFLANEGLWGIGMLILGIVLIIGAIVLHAHYASINAVCSSPLGDLGQVFSSTASNDCSMAGTAEGAVGPFLAFGIPALLIGGGIIVRSMTRAGRFLKNSN
jgi:hypothetical protein